MRWALMLFLVGAFSPEVVRTADPVKRGLKESDFPRVIPLAEGVYAYEDLRSAGDERFTTTNLFVITSEGVLVADGQGSPDATKRLVDAISKLTTRPIKVVVICSDHGDHTAGNASFPEGATFIAHPTSKATLERDASAPNRRPDAPKVILPTELVPEKKTLILGGREIQILFLGRAHTGGDLNLYLPKEKILFMSEAYLNRVFPAMRSAYPSEWVQMLKKAEAMDVTLYVPGHGFVEEPKISREELVTYREAMESVIAEVTRLQRTGATVEQATAQANFGPYGTWSLATQQGPIAVRKVYEELEGKLK